MNLNRQGYLNREDKTWLTLVGIIFTCLCLYPIWASTYGLYVIRDGLIFGIFAISLDFMYGRAGMLNWGQAAFFGIGAYGMAIVSLALKHPNAGLLGLLTGMICAATVALVVGGFLIYAGVRGPYFVIMTIALTLVVSQLAMSWSSFTGGDAGLVGVPPIRLKLSNFYYSFDSDLATYFLSLMLATTVLLTLWFVCRGNYGKILSAIENDEIRAQTLGINTNLHILVVFIVSAILAALSGAIFASFSGFVAPDIAGIILSTEVILWVMVGGRGTFIGPVLGAILVMKIQQEISSVSTSLWPFVLGIFFVIIVFVLPNGLLPLIRRIILRLGEKTRTFGYSKPDATRD